MFVSARCGIQEGHSRVAEGLFGLVVVSRGNTQLQKNCFGWLEGPGRTFMLQRNGFGSLWDPKGRSCQRDASGVAEIHCWNGSLWDPRGTFMLQRIASARCGIERDNHVGGIPQGWQTFIDGSRLSSEVKEVCRQRGLRWSSMHISTTIFRVSHVQCVKSEADENVVSDDGCEDVVASHLNSAAAASGGSSRPLPPNSWLRFCGQVRRLPPPTTSLHHSPPRTWAWLSTTRPSGQKTSTRSSMDSTDTTPRQPPPSRNMSAASAKTRNTTAMRIWRC